MKKKIFSLNNYINENIKPEKKEKENKYKNKEKEKKKEEELIKEKNKRKRAKRKRRNGSKFGQFLYFFTRKDTTRKYI